MGSPKVLIFDIETAPILAYVWGLRDQNVGLNQIHHDSHVIAWAAKWMGAPASQVMYRDQRDAKDIRDDKEILKPLWKLLDEADIVITQNGKNFDSPRLNARFLIHGMRPPSPYRHLDTMQTARKVARFTSNKLEYLTEKLCTKYKKLQHKKFPGFELWDECLKGNRAAWNEMRTYNIHDVLATEELHMKLQAWDSSINLNVYRDINDYKCSCGGRRFESKGYAYTSVGKFQRFTCKRCGKSSASRVNLLTVAERRLLTKSAGGQ